MMSLLDLLLLVLLQTFLALVGSQFTVGCTFRKVASVFASACGASRVFPSI